MKNRESNMINNNRRSKKIRKFDEKFTLRKTNGGKLGKN